jgi:hypothetical protein
MVLHILIFKFLEDRRMTKDSDQIGSKHAPSLIKI